MSSFKGVVKLLSFYKILSMGAADLKHPFYVHPSHIHRLVCGRLTYMTKHRRTDRELTQHLCSLGCHNDVDCFVKQRLHAA